LGDREAHVDGPQLIDDHQDGVAHLHHVLRLDEAAPGAAGDGRADLAVREVEPRGLDRRLVALERGLRGARLGTRARGAVLRATLARGKGAGSDRAGEDPIHCAACGGSASAPVSCERVATESSQSPRACTSCARALASADCAVSRSRMLPTPALYRPCASSAEASAEARRSRAVPTRSSAVFTAW